MKWHGKIGFETQVEVSLGPGKATVWRPEIVPRHYYGKVGGLGYLVGCDEFEEGDFDE